MPISGLQHLNTPTSQASNIIQLYVSIFLYQWSDSRLCIDIEINELFLCLLDSQLSIDTKINQSVLCLLESQLCIDIENIQIALCLLITGAIFNDVLIAKSIVSVLCLLESQLCINIEISHSVLCLQVVCEFQLCIDMEVSNSDTSHEDFFFFKVARSARTTSMLTCTHFGSLFSCVRFLFKPSPPPPKFLLLFLL